MRKLVFAIALVVLNTPVWAQVSPYPDTSPTGNRQADAAKLSAAQAEYDKVGGEVKDNEKKFNDLKPMIAKLEGEEQAIVAKRDALQKEWDKKADGFNAQCSSQPITINSAAWAACQQLQTKLQGEKTHHYDRKAVELANERKLKRDEIQRVRSDQLVYQTEIQRRRSWQSQVNPGLRALKASIVAPCKALLQRNATPEELKAECGNIQFDGSRSGLPPCTTVECIRARVLD